MKLKITYGFFAVSFAFFLLIAVSAQADFRNQLHALGGDTADIIRHAQVMGYEWIFGTPWSQEKAEMGKAGGLKVMFNSTAGEEAKWLRFNNPGGVGSMLPPTRVNDQVITAQMYQDFKQMFIMKDASAPDTDLKRKYYSVAKYERDNQVMFYNQYLCSSGIDLMVRYNKWLYDLHGGPAVYDGLWMDQVNYIAALRSIEAMAAAARNPCLTSSEETVYPSLEVGQLEYIRRMRNYFNETLSGLGVSGNPYNISSYSTRHTQVPLNFYYNEKGEERVSEWGVIPARFVALEIERSLQSNYLKSLEIAGAGAAAGAWWGIGFYDGNIADGSIANPNILQLIHALPNWDNMVNATGRSWNTISRTYTSSNSHADPNVVYGRRWTDGKLFVVWQTNTAPVTLRSGESVISVKCVNDLFLETSDCASHVTVSTSNPKTITLNSSANELKGYVITHTGGGGTSSGSTTGGTSGSTTGIPPPSGCNQYTSSSAIPDGFASAFWVVQNPSQALISVNCPPTGPASLSAGASASNVYVYKDVYVHKDGSWQKLTLSGAPAYGGAWYQGAATAASLPFTNEELTTQRYAVAYVCTYANSQWKCGCRTSACTGADSGKWSLMAFRRE